MWHSPQFSANVHCGQTAGWTKMPGDFVFDGDPAPPEKKAQPPPAPPEKKGTAPIQF